MSSSDSSESSDYNEQLKEMTEHFIQTASLSKDTSSSSSNDTSSSSSDPLLRLKSSTAWTSLVASTKASGRLTQAQQDRGFTLILTKSKAISSLPSDAPISSDDSDFSAYEPLHVNRPNEQEEGEDRQLSPDDIDVDIHPYGN
jgi:hypothetical protein